MKYIIVEEPVFKLELPIVFAEPIAHATVAGKNKVVSAGFCEPVAGRWITEGRSESLNVASRPQDGAVIARGLFLTTR